MTGTQLPDWLAAELPEVRPHGLVDVAGPRAVVYVAPDGGTTTFPDVETAYESLRGVDLEFSEELVRREDSVPGLITFPSDREGLLTAWIAHNDTQDRTNLEEAFRESLEYAATYRRDGGSVFVSAFRYVDTHPAFWVRTAAVDGAEPASWSWETDGHMNRVHLEVTTGGDGSGAGDRAVLIELETGMHTPDLTDHYDDPYLGAAGRTFEDAVIMLARNVALTFNDDGTETGSRPPNPWADQLLADLQAQIEKTEDGDG